MRPLARPLFEGSASAVGGSVDAPAGAVAGERSSLTVELNGEPLATRILEGIRAGLAGAECDVRVEGGGG